MILIDQEAREITLKGGIGTTRTFAVEPEVDQLGNIHAGDQWDKPEILLCRKRINMWLLISDGA